ncbi:MAG: ATP-binding protein [Deltaproteobacteria bacterium]
MQEFEKLGVFYLGREVDPADGARKENLLLYDSRDLVTHAVCVGMTGSGKTGLCIGLLEEAAIDGIPAIVVDPKGDLANLLLTFPDLAPEDFLPWINRDDARRKGLSPEEYAKAQADLWRKGLAEWGQDGERIRRLRESAEFALYTPGGSAGLPVSVLRSFAPPDKAFREDADLLRERVGTTVTGLLGLLGIEADPVRSREHILLSTLLDAAWREGRETNLPALIQAIQSPPVSRIGVFDLESFYPAKERFALAMQLNNLLAAPGFGAWMEGEPLEIDRMLHTPEGKPRVAIFSIAHLSDPERMFFVSLLLTQLLGWMRAQPGTTSLRALFYMDEIFGYFPPVANPPSKAPLLTLLKQARAFGLGVVLATQNPVDLDYKGLSNTGTWFIGRLQTERDKERILEGLEGAAAGQGGRFDRKRTGELLAGLKSRVFLMNNVHEDGPVLFETRWVLSYLRGPIGREEIRTLTEGKAATPPPPAAVPEAPRRSSAEPSARPVLPPSVPQLFLPAKGSPPAGCRLGYEPMLIAAGTVYYGDRKAGISTEETVVRLAEFPAGPGGIDWEEGTPVPLAPEDLRREPEEGASFGRPPSEAGVQKNYDEWGSGFRDWIYRRKGLSLLRSPSLSLLSSPGESERDFRIRLRQASREARDRELERLRKEYARPAAALEEKIRRARMAVEREQEQAKQQKLQTAISFGATLLSALMGRKAVSMSTIGRAGTTASRAGRVLKESRDVATASENLAELERRLAELNAKLEEETARIREMDPAEEPLDTVSLRPKKQDIRVSLVALCWAPVWRDDRGGIRSAW